MQFVAVPAGAGRMERVLVALIGSAVGLLDDDRAVVVAETFEDAGREYSFAGFGRLRR